MEITAKELRSQVRKVLDTVERGEEVIITYRGKQRARIEATGDAITSAKLTDAPLYGIWSDHAESESVQNFIDSIRASRN